MSIEQSLNRIAVALEVIAQHVNPGVAVLVDDVEHVARHPTLTNPPLTWFSSSSTAADAVSDAHDDGKAAITVQPGPHKWNPPGTPIPTRPDQLPPRRPGQTTWDWLGVTPPATRTREKMPVEDEYDLPKNRGTASTGSASWTTLGRPAGRPGHCGRCRREGRRRMNHSDRCIDCADEEWWDE